MTLAISVLGGLDIRCDGHRATPKIPKRAASLLAYLALQHGRPVSRERLADLFWPDHFEQARHSLRNSLWELHKIIGRPVVVASFTECRLDDYTLDAIELEEAVANQQPIRVAELYRGPLLMGIHIDSEPWEEWLTVERERLQTLTINALHDRADGLLLEGDITGAIDLAERALRIDPTHEPAHRQIILAHSLCGRHSAAKKAYQRCSDLLKRDLGIQPDQETRRLVQQTGAAPFAIAARLLPSEAERQSEYQRGYEAGKLRGYELAIAHLMKQRAVAVARSQGQGPVTVEAAREADPQEASEPVEAA